MCCSPYFTVAFKKELDAIEGDQGFPHKETDQCQREHEKCQNWENEESYKFIKDSSRKIEVIYNSESQGPLLTRAFFPFDPKVSFGLAHLIITCMCQ